MPRRLVHLIPNFSWFLPESVTRILKIYLLLLAGIPTKWICIDIANGYISKFLEFCNKVRKTFPNHIIVVGNVATREMVETLLIEANVDVVKVGIGPGSVCTTRKKNRCRYASPICVLECADAAHGVGKYIVSDGGITCPGDMSKAFLVQEPISL